MSSAKLPRINRQALSIENIALFIGEHPLVSSLMLLSLCFLIFIWLGLFIAIWGLAGVTISVAILLGIAAVFLYYKKRRRENLISRAISVLKKREKMNYRNLDSRSIIDAFEKTSGVFYLSYEEIPESILVEIREEKIEKIKSAASRLTEKLTEMTAQKFVDVRTGTTSFFAVRTEDELVEEIALDQIVTLVKRIADMMHSVKYQVIDIPIWRLNGRIGLLERKIGLLLLISAETNLFPVRRETKKKELVKRLEKLIEKA
jgi:hypothetical protein